MLSVAPVIDEGTVRCRWRVKYVSFTRIIMNPRLLRFDYRMQNLSWFDGYSVLTVDGNGEVYKVTLQKVFVSRCSLKIHVISDATRRTEKSANFDYREAQRKIGSFCCQQLIFCVGINFRFLLYKTNI